MIKRSILSRHTKTCWVALLGLIVVVVQAAEPMVGVKDSRRAEFNWVMHCRGCHQMDATGSVGGAPNMVGVVAQFLHLPEGRDFLGRVPGVAFVSLPDDQVAELLNWMVQTFDAGHVPEGFQPYTASEVGRLRKRPLVAEAESTRLHLLDVVAQQKLSD